MQYTAPHSFAFKKQKRRNQRNPRRELLADAVHHNADAETPGPQPELLAENSTTTQTQRTPRPQPELLAENSTTTQTQRTRSLLLHNRNSLQPKSHLLAKRLPIFVLLANLKDE